jgi:UDP-glucose 4-epimerase
MSKEVVLVTGGAGFIGAHVAEELLKLDFQVVVLDDLSGGFEDNVPGGATFVEGSILDVKLLDDLFQKYQFSYVFHLAAYAAEGLSHFIKRFNYTNNVIGSVNLINESVENNVKCFVFTSSIAVYGTNQLPMKEELTPEPEDSYGIAKYAVERELQVSKEMFDLDYIIFRPHNVYGEKQNLGDKYRNVLGIFMNKIMQGEELPIFGDGEQTRSFSYIGDMAPLIAQSIQNQKCYNEVFNIGADQNYSINQLVELIGEAFNVDPKKKYLDARNEVMHAYSDHTKIRAFFGEHPTVDIRDGIQQMAKWAKKAGVRESKKFENIELTKNLPPSWKE